MVRLIVLLLFLAAFSNAKELTLDPNIEKSFGIKTIKVKKEVAYDVDEYPGVVIEDPTKTAVISSPVEGIIDSIFVKKGSFVKKGQTVATVVSPEINQILSQIEVAKVKVQTTKNILDRDELLYKEEVIPYSRYFSSKVEYENALANLRALEKTLASYGTVKNGKLLINAKTSGVVLELYAFVGSPVNVGKEIGKIANLDEVIVVAQVPYEKVSNIKPNDTAIILTPDKSEFFGKVILVDYQLNPQTRRNEIRIIAKNKGFQLKPNMFVNVRFSKVKESGLIIPKSAVIVHAYRNYVIVKENNKYKLREVVVGKSLDDKVVVISGLNEGEEVVVSGVNLLKKEFLEGEK
ncbi:MAG: efflux RND transporter periplasmic adaptor subunit [Sulfurihydrogenibium sp.]|uniref:efflux RND transporter periplasmic adaptor subunit n=1 Tax=Sulfurihydrogenibium sp. TaxID=2053621 RepID=UPI003D10C31A